MKSEQIIQAQKSAMVKIAETVCWRNLKMTSSIFITGMYISALCACHVVASGPELRSNKSEYSSNYVMTGADECGKGPTIQLDYGTGHLENAIDNFMYFIPLISPTLVECSTNQANRQNARITSFKTDCRRAGIPDHVSEAIMGHSDGNSMSKRYDDISDQDRLDAVSKLEAYRASVRQNVSFKANG